MVNFNPDDMIAFELFPSQTEVLY